MEESLDFKRTYKHKKVVVADRIKIPIASINDLIKLKTKAGRPRDQIDIEALRRLQRKKHEK